jgi:hypothetical protein
MTTTYEVSNRQQKRSNFNPSAFGNSAKSEQALESLSNNERLVDNYAKIASYKSQSYQDCALTS